MSDDALIEEIKNRHLIEQVLRRYSRGVDRGDAELIRSVYHDDGIDDHGGFKGRGQEFADVLVKNTQDHWLASNHNLHQINIDFDGDTAWTETHFTAHHRIRNDEGVTVLESFGGRYCDRFEKRDGEWKIAQRIVVHDWSRIQDVPNEYPTEAFEQGKRSKDDLSYKRF
ncbi:MAG: nuclear transport factor 2 family protein [Kiritimatiellia bacterium]|jgi:hypothetical protein|nr:nuclear transport factor 2 family protein [Pseudomonadales bacterium]MDP6469395.1 nuclear transport factor 2 family protein [Pseudomonadales bacterium]MDP6828986.1 nuclear transport factor 2 family protein [Pseudomonadales bacterium]MDP7024692.1 nuclear transport factor 2 family protein [Kiritimatiellia bacterium]|tara:strand:+ start:1064 stop:1570 length:507 start_codon:yes stop_codon:yes gene_type:complete